MPDAAFVDALVHYRNKFKTLESLGVDAADWEAELARVTPEALDPVLGTSVGLEGGSVAGVRNFAAVNKVRALHARRAELDEEYTNPYTIEIPEPMAREQLGIPVRLGR